MCEEPGPPCKPSAVVDIASQLGQAVSWEIEESSMFDQMCM